MALFNLPKAIDPRQNPFPLLVDSIPSRSANISSLPTTIPQMLELAASCVRVILTPLTEKFLSPAATSITGSDGDEISIVVEARPSPIMEVPFTEIWSVCLIWQTPPRFEIRML